MHLLSGEDQERARRGPRKWAKGEGQEKGSPQTTTTQMGEMRKDSGACITITDCTP